MRDINISMKFQDWIWQEELTVMANEYLNWYFARQFDETLFAKVPRDNPKDVLAKKLQAYYLRSFGQSKDKFSIDEIVNGVRHFFTSYDDEWPSAERNIDKGRTVLDGQNLPEKFQHPLTKAIKVFDLSDPCEQIMFWNSLMQATADLVEAIIHQIDFNPKYKPAYLEGNQKWLKSKIRDLPVTCR